jgi:hypothetical protein
MMSDATHSLVVHVTGRLVVAQLRVLSSPSDVAALSEAMRRIVQSLEGPIVICADYREAAVLSQPAADAFLGMLATFNPRIERSGILLAAEHATFNLQVERLVREARALSRRTFRAVPALVAWLGEVLTTRERTGLAEVVGMTATGTAA